MFSVGVHVPKNVTDAQVHLAFGMKDWGVRYDFGRCTYGSGDTDYCEIHYKDATPEGLAVNDKLKANKAHYIFIGDNQCKLMSTMTMDEYRARRNARFS